ncbi:DUF4286 family protein [Parapedobacter sp. 10938]|uniref:DUF4286 family protein n=1 Tax=Parapedobacter flavus TaxID=3110225 RepID=UPI002DBAF67A|nr:DUF4286 family protein [Parapedobacter sp. 10938]MEC3879802.1 DUF4286 family protein [Parapedobacter sp. 10938]
MYLYNVTIIVENDIREAVKTHLHVARFDEQLPDAVFSLLELLDSPHDGATYCVQLRCKDRATIADFQAGGLTVLKTGLHAQYPGKIVFFDSTMKYLND